ncbi:MAG TPA: hypothetical protein VGI81_11425 [Tepidisphaeraceae bacterium]|jgi:hypothetical protein
MKCRALLVLALLLLAVTAARGQEAAWTFSAGYSNIQFNEHTNGTFYTRDGPYFDFDFLFRIPESKVPLLVGGGFGASGYFDSRDVTFPAFSGFASTTLYSDVSLFSFEARAAMPISFGRGPRGFFIMPKIGMGLLVSNYAIDTVQVTPTVTILNTRYFTGAAFDIRPTIQAGYSWGPGSAGIEASYMIAWGDFGDLGSQAQEVRIGAFFRFRF